MPVDADARLPNNAKLRLLRRALKALHECSRGHHSLGPEIHYQNILRFGTVDGNAQRSFAPERPRFSSAGQFEHLSLTPADRLQLSGRFVPMKKALAVSLNECKRRKEFVGRGVRDTPRGVREGETGKKQRGKRDLRRGWAPDERVDLSLGSLPRRERRVSVLAEKHLESATILEPRLCAF